MVILLHRASVQALHVLDVDGLTTAGDRLIFNGGARLRIRAVELPHVPAGPPDAHGHRHTQDPGTLIAHLSHQAHQRFNGVLVPARHHDDGGEAQENLPAAASPQSVVHHLADRDRHQFVRKGLALPGPVADLTHGHHLLGAHPDIHAEAFYLPLQLPALHGTQKQLLQKFLPQQRQALSVYLRELGNVPPLGEFFVQQVPHPAQNVRELFGVYRFEYIFHHIELDGLLRVFKLVKSGEYDQLQIGLASGQLCPQLQPVHEGHFDVGEHHIQVQRFRFLKGVSAVLRVGHDLKAHCFPVYLMGDALPDLGLIVHDHDFIEAHSGTSHQIQSWRNANTISC